MFKHYQALLSEWEFVRRCSREFIGHLSDAELDRKLPRKGLDTFRKHFQEMSGVQQDYIAAIKSGKVSFTGGPDDHLSGDWTKEQLLAAMDAADASLAKVLADAGEEDTIDWFGEKRMLASHLAALISHEMLHIGQIVAFCYALGIDIPEFVREQWALSG